MEQRHVAAMANRLWTHCPSFTMHSSW